MSERVALVTGAARGIGRATAELFLEKGWRVSLLDIDADQLQATIAEIARPEATEALVCDVAEPDQVAAAIDRHAAQFGRLDALVNNAGIAVFGPIRECSFADWSRVLAVNLSGPFLMTQAATELLIAEGGGAVVNVTSISGLRASTLRVAYGTSKAGLAQLSLQQAAELGEHGVRVNAVAPGPVDTKLSRAVHTKEIRAAYRDAIPLARYGSELEIAAMIVFLCGPEASYVTAQVIAVDGGFGGTGIGLPALRVTPPDA